MVVVLLEEGLHRRIDGEERLPEPRPVAYLEGIDHRTENGITDLPGQVGRNAADDGRQRAFGAGGSQREGEDGAAGVPPDVASRGALRVEDGLEVLELALDGVLGGVGRLVAAAVAEQVDGDHAVVRGERVEVAHVDPSVG